MDKFEGVEYFEVEAHEDKIILRPVKIMVLPNTSLSKIKKKIAALQLNENDIEEAITWARKKEKSHH